MLDPLPTLIDLGTLGRAGSKLSSPQFQGNHFNPGAIVISALTDVSVKSNLVVTLVTEVTVVTESSYTLFSVDLIDLRRYARLPCSQVRVLLAYFSIAVASEFKAT